jgi:hypothetical protein
LSSVRLDGVVRLSGQRAAMADQDPAFVTVAQRGIGDAVSDTALTSSVSSA